MRSQILDLCSQPATATISRIILGTKRSNNLVIWGYVIRLMLLSTTIYERDSLCQNLHMGKAGKALRQVLSTYGISQNRLAVTMGINRSTVHQWVNEISDPLAEAVTHMIKALREINSTAAEDFIDLYLERQSSQPSPDPPEDNL